MNVLMVNYEFPPFGGGTGTACARLLKVFAARANISVDLVTSGPSPGLRRQAIGEGIVVHRLPVPKKDLHYWRPLELARWTVQALVYARRLARTQTYDVCHCWAGWPSGIVGLALSERVPYVVSLRGSDVPGYNSRLTLLDPLLMRRLVRLVWRRSARVTAVSRDLRRLAHQSAPQAVIDVIPNGIDDDWAARKVFGGRDLLFVGRLIERKGVHLLLQAFARLAGDYPAVTLTIAGSGPERSALEQMARKILPPGRVRFTGHLQRTALREAYASAGIFVLPASRDAMPNAVLEAMASGLAIVTTRTGAAERIDGNGTVVELPTVGQLRDAIARYLDDADLLARHQRRSQELAHGVSWSAVADYFSTVYREVAAAMGGAPARPARDFIATPEAASAAARAGPSR
jgi:glycosyltransferase involved in cell wall biosynthesis